MRSRERDPGRDRVSAPHVLVSGVVLGQPMGGVRRHNAELLPRVARLLAAAGGSLSVLEGAQKIAFELPPDVVRIASDVPPGAWARARQEPRALRAAFEHAAQGGRAFDLFHAAHLPVPTRIGARYTLTIHDLRHTDRRFSSVARRIAAEIALRRALDRAALVFAVGASVRAELVARFGVSAERVRIVPNAADHFTPLPRHAAADAPMLCVGHVERRKNLEIVLRAMHVEPRLPRLEIAGAAKHGERERLARLAEELRVSSRVSFLGPFDDRELAALYARAACVVLPSHLEGFGIGTLEAQRARVPLAIASLPALLEVAGAETPSFAPDDPEACARAILRALSASPTTLDRAEANAARFSWDASARAWFDAWCELAS